MQHSASGTLQKKIAAFSIFRFILKMIRGINADSKLCAVQPRHAIHSLPSTRMMAPLGKGGVASRCIPPWPLPRRVEAVIAFTPSAVRR